MKFIPSQLMYLLDERETRQNIVALLKFLVLMGVTIAVFSALFHVIMVYEGQDHSWLTGLYWALTVMSTLGFGDITFRSDLGRVFSIVVLLTGIVMLLIVLPFTFIRFFYAPWLEAQIRLRAPRAVPPELCNHVVICTYDAIAMALIPHLEMHSIPYVVVEPDPNVAANLHGDGVSVVTGEPTAAATYVAAGAARARMVFANVGDATNTNLTLAVREVAGDVPILALAENDNAIDILEFSGVSEVLPLKRVLGEHLARRVSVGAPRAHRLGRFEDLVIAEFPIENTSLPGRTIRDTQLSELTGVDIVAVWERGHLLPAGPDTVLRAHNVPVIVGTEDEITGLDALFVIYQTNENPVLIIGGGKVGGAAAQALQAQGIRVTILDKNPPANQVLADSGDRYVEGDAADLDVVLDAGVAEASSVMLTTNDDATNIFLAVYCRRLNPDVRIVSRITDEWNLEAIYRAGADFALSHGSLAARSVLSTVRRTELVVFGEGADLFIDAVPPGLEGKTLAESGIADRTGLHVIALGADGASVRNPPPDSVLVKGSSVVMLGTVEQHQTFARLFA